MIRQKEQLKKSRKRKREKKRRGDYRPFWGEKSSGSTKDVRNRRGDREQRLVRETKSTKIIFFKGSRVQKEKWEEGGGNAGDK